MLVDKQTTFSKTSSVNPNWIDREKLNNRNYLSGVTAGIYVMTAKGDTGLCRSGVIGIQHMENNAWKRLVQLKNGNLKNEGPWEFIFLAPLPNDLGTDLRKAEIDLQTTLAAEFDVGAKAQFRTADFAKVQDVACQAALDFVTAMEFDGTIEFEAALKQYVDALAEGEPRHTDQRRHVLKALRMCLDGPLAVRLLTALQ